MSETKKLDQQELDTIMSLRQKMSEKVMQFGELEVEMHLTKQRATLLETEKERLTTEFESLQTEEKNIADGLNQKYGQGTLNIETGEFVPA